MPCYQVRTMSVEFQAKHRDLLDEALKSLGWNSYETDQGLILAGRGIRIDLGNQQAEVEAGVGQSNLNRLKQAYSEQALKRVARLKGWHHKSTNQNNGILRRF